MDNNAPIPARVDAVAKVTGAATFAVDLTFPGSLHAAVVRSDRAHARIRAVDTAQARRMPGFVNVVTFDDLAPLFPWFGHITPDHPILADGTVRYYGEPVALVVATDPRAAADAATAVRVDYDDLPAVISCSDALADDAPPVHPERDRPDDRDSIARLDGPVRRAPTGNVAHEVVRDWGDVDAAFAVAAEVVETTAHYPMLYAYAMEPYNASARFTSGGSLEVVTATQHPYMVVRDLARIFRMPHSRIRVQVPYLGGSYGSKSYTKLEPLVAAAAWYCRRPIKLVLDIPGSVHTGRSLDADVRIRSAFAADGLLLARDVDLVMNMGAYVENSLLELDKAVNRSFGPYHVPNLRVRGRSVYTNTVPAASYRGFGAFQGNLAGETNIDQAAARLGLTGAQLRRRNLVRRGATFIPGTRPMDADLPADLDLLTEALAADCPPPAPGLLRGVGLGMSASDAGALPTSTAYVRICSDGSAVVLSGSTEMGQGSATVLAAVAARELGLPRDAITVTQSDTAVTSFERTTGASRTTVITGLAVQRACQDALRRVATMAADLWDVAAGTVTAAGGSLRTACGDHRLGYGETIEQWFGPGGGEAVGIGVVRRDGVTRELPPFWEIGAVGVVLDVDPQTGLIRIVRVVTVADVGHAVSPVLLAGQDTGAALQGLGAALSEELTYDGDQIGNPNLVEYQVPRIGDRPAEHAHLLAERGDGIGPYGAKGAGEGSRNPIGGAVASAVADATGVWAGELPLTPERMWRALRTRAGMAD